MLTFNNLSVGYPKGKQGRIVAEKLNATLFPGRLVCLLGPNGAGKSTLLRTLAGLQKACAGQILINGKALPEISQTARAGLISVILTETFRSANISVREAVRSSLYGRQSLFGQITEEDKLLINKSLSMVSAEHFSEKTLGEISDGEFKKVMTARALAQNTPYILADEPTAHLDIPARAEVFALLKFLSENENKAVLVSTHAADLAVRYADEIWILDRKGVLHCGEPEELLLSDTFEKVFGKDNLYFDYRSQTFFAHNSEDPIAKAGGEGLLHFCAENLLRRAGFRLDAQADLQLSGRTQHEEAPVWEVESPEGKQLFRRSADAFLALKKLRAKK